MITILKKSQSILVRGKKFKKVITLKLTMSINIVKKFLLLWSIPSMIIGNSFSLALPEWVFIFVTIYEYQNRPTMLLSFLIDSAEVFITTMSFFLCIRIYNEFESNSLRSQNEKLITLKLSIIAKFVLLLVYSVLYKKLVEFDKLENFIMISFIKESGQTLSKYLDLIALLIFAPIWEEILFRGFLLQQLTKKISIPFSIILSSIFFAIAHLNGSYFLVLFILGVLLGFAFLHSSNIFTSIFAHSLWNLFIVNLSFQK